MRLTTNPCEDGSFAVFVAFFLFFSFVYIVRRISPLDPAVANQHVAKSTIGKKLEDVFVTPFIPPSMAFFAAFLGIFAFSLTAPMIYSRLMEGRWLGEFIGQQDIPNKISEFVGCKPFNDGNITYYHYPLNGSPIEENVETKKFLGLFGRKKKTQQANVPMDLPIDADWGPKDHHEYTDLAIGLHVSAGLLWILLGAVQMYFAPKLIDPEIKGRKRRRYSEFHKWIGIIGTLSVYLHALGACHILYRDIVHHNLFPKMMLFSDVVMFSYYIGRGIQLRHDKTSHHVHHRTMMFMGFVHAIEGSGQIRFTAWYIWIVSRYLPLDIAKLVDTTVCQELSIFHGGYRAAATDCIFPYMIRMNLLRACTIYFKILFFRLPMNNPYKKARAVVSQELFDQAKLFGISLLSIAIMSLVPQSLQDMFNDNLLIIFFYGNQLAQRAKVHWMPFVAIASVSFLISHYCNGLVNFQDESFYDDAFFGLLTIIFFTNEARKYTKNLLDSLRYEE